MSDLAVNQTPTQTPVVAQITHQHHHEHQARVYQHHHHWHGTGPLAEANKDFFNNNTDIFETYPHAKERAKRTALSIVDKVKLDKENTSVLEFGCGNGLVCKELLPYVKTITGIDISEGTVKLFNNYFQSQGEAERVKAFATNLETDQSVIEGKKFDVIYCASAFHHFDSPQGITKLLSAFLAPTGSLLIIDNWLSPTHPKDSSGSPAIPEEYKHIVSHAGFTEDDMKKIYEGAGLELVSYDVVPPDEGDSELFIAKGVFKM
ncbi:S-adenosyl-L-methionine-dependent methyltransferase [Coprinopsis marcescibilis]|uniref:S-adenosyl-L-methionine-dependent methyltransferase n=1 Tax=Coprinopsis marcescibilis TaxID=230819 RepID=A0A5C3KTB0_COPMA|nr:S-adenosyl-L-methionine-dependent methyltransferase [Coprinopsis marcescibilis]